MKVQRFSSKELKIGHLRHLHFQYSHRFSSKQNHQKKMDTFYKAGSHLSTAVAWREKICKHFVYYKYFSLVLGLLKSRISEKTIEPLLNKPDFKLFHYKARVQPVSKITTIATRNRCYM